VKNRQRIRKEKEAYHRKNLRDFKSMQREAAVATGKNLRDFPELLSSDDENYHQWMKKEIR
jgi:hypothetical protein